MNVQVEAWLVDQPINAWVLIAEDRVLAKRRRSGTRLGFRIVDVVHNTKVGKPTDEVCHLWYRCLMAKPSPVARLLALATAAQRDGDAARARKLLDAAIEHMDNDKAVPQQQQQEQLRTKD